MLQPLRWCCVDCEIHHERDVREEQHHTYMWREQAIIEYCCLLPQCEALRICRSGFPIATKWCCDQDVKVVRSSAFTQRTCDRCGSLKKGGDVVATSPVVLRWLCDSPRTGCAWRTTPYIYVARTSNNRVNMACELYCCLLPQCEALRICRSGFPIATLVWSFRDLD